jgi:hypothetical protein
MELRDVVSVVGLIFGVAGSVLGVLNYLRDRHQVEVSLRWDMDVTPQSGYDHTKKWGMIVVTNVGRRPTYVSHVALKLPKNHEHTYLLICDGILGKKLSEGDPSEVFVIDQDGLEKYSDDWNKVVAQVSDSSGKVWLSKSPTKKPSWAILK